MDLMEYLERQRKHEQKIWQCKNKKVRRIRKLKEKLSSDNDEAEEQLEEIEEQEMEEREIVGQMLDRLNQILDD